MEREMGGVGGSTQFYETLKWNDGIENKDLITETQRN